MIPLPLSNLFHRTSRHYFATLRRTIQKHWPLLEIGMTRCASFLRPSSRFARMLYHPDHCTLTDQRLSLDVESPDALSSGMSHLYYRTFCALASRLV